MTPCESWPVRFASTSDSATVAAMSGGVPAASKIALAKLDSGDDFYKATHNHGMDQNRALLAFTLKFPLFTHSDTWQALASARFLSSHGKPY